MTDSHGTAGHGAEVHHGPSIQTYLVIFGALLFFTTTSFVANYLAHEDVHLINRFTSFAIIMGVAVCKAVLVGMYFMHLKFEWGKLYFLVIPVMILTVMMMLVLLPDNVLTWHNPPPLGQQ